jgi:NitT/TauT family transport system permease protein
VYATKGLFAELIGSNEGLGRYVIRAQRFLHTERLLAAVVIIGCIGWLSDLVLRRAHRRLFPWFRIATGNDR